MARGEAVAPGESPTAPADEAVAPADAGKGRILVIDDDDGVRQFIVDCLETSGYRVTGALNGVDGLKEMEGERPSLLIVDYAMPGMNGVEVVEEVRRRAPGLPVILATGYADMAAVDSVVAPERVLRKPFRIDDLQTAVRAALSGADAA